MDARAERGSAASHTLPIKGQARNLVVCPDQEWNQQHFGACNTHTSQSLSSVLHSVLVTCMGNRVHCVCCLVLWWEGFQGGRGVQP